MPKKNAYKRYCVKDLSSTKLDSYESSTSARFEGQAAAQQGKVLQEILTGQVTCIE